MPLVAAFKRWLFRLYGPEPSPIVLTQRRIYVLPTRPGLAYAAALGLMLVGAINYNLGLGYALIFLLAGLGLVTLLHTFRNLVRIEISPGRVEPVFAGDVVQFGLQLHNRRGPGRFAIRLKLADGEAVTIDLAPEASTAIYLPLPSRKRGWLRPGRVTLETRYPLCLIRAWSYVEPDMRCLVYPRPETSPPPLPLMAVGESGAARSGRGSDDFAGLRTHQPADSPRHVAWKAVAREQSLLTKQFSGAGTVQAWLDWDTLPQELGVETRLSRLTRWLLDAHAQGLAYGLRLPGREIPLGQGERQLQDCLEALAVHGE
ncbi:MAG: hypothetical protein EFKGCFLK_02198 [Rhodocyclaceae bacterium]|nr:MAG: DUF58 domain-containing protein [Rhodocyclaceae bacterium]MBE7422250.1 DUF58 domain-containing protein [Zoogloeaceae bacterium]MBV6408601.1 hypothetical protein [Rhodocyclaceae bacterium]CAG0930654.1 hypothetical protein RHDC3_01566 [Rhodocyclaceae bacterium]